MKNKFIEFLNKKGKNIFEIIYFFITFIFFLVLGLEIAKKISLTQIFIIFVVFSIFYFIIKNNSSKNSKINKNFLEKYSQEIFYSSFLTLTIIFVLGLFYPSLEYIFKYFFYGFLFIYILLKFFGLQIDYNIGKINFLTTNFLKISIILLSIVSIIIYKNIHFEPIKETKKITKKVDKKQKKKVEKKVKIKEEILEELPEFETFEEKLKRLEKQKKKIVLKDELDFKNIEKYEEIEDFEQNLYPRTKGQEKEIERLQKKLKKLGVFSGKINGIYDEKTLESIKQILIKKCDWPETTKGYFGPQARECINSL